MHYYKRNLGDYAKKAGRLSMLEHGAYTLLMDTIYDREIFPTLDEALDWTWARDEAEIAAVKFVLTKFFELQENGRYVQKRIFDELNDYKAKAETNARIAKEREEKRKSKHEASRTVNESCEEKHEAPPNHKPITINQEPLTNNHNIKNNNVDLSARRESVVQVFEFWKEVFGKNAATKLNTVRERKIKQRLDDGYTVEQIKTAIVNCSKSEFHIQGGHTDIELICRDGIKLERFIEMTVAQQQAQTDPWATYFQNLGKQTEVDATPVMKEVGYVKS